MRTSHAGMAFLARHEALVLTAYKDGPGYSIGFGHFDPTLKGDEVIEPEAALALFRADLQRFEAGIAKMAAAYLCRHMFDAPVSASYNLGLGGLGRSAVIERLNARDYLGAGDALLPLTKGLAGLSIS